MGHQVGKFSVFMKHQGTKFNVFMGHQNNQISVFIGHQHVKSRFSWEHQNVKKLSVFVGPPDIKILARSLDIKMSKSYWVYGTSRCQNLIGSIGHQDVKSRVFMGHQNVKKLVCSWDLQISKS
ncbi:hypothetical protein CDAR_249021 [Caerostris darwini]|uniref:Uncharacterized protein n=1 Tax=Caerostris darwini TaxID=1538125 RepID=A0AAV4SAE4_9ARAC|nr:hypothetical protein CDAR_249021 [Caerostris darwini]